MIESDTGCVLKLFPHGERGAIVSWCTSHHGIVRTVAHSLLKPGSEMSGVVDLFHECELLFRTSSKSDLCTLTSANLLDARLGLRNSWNRLCLAGYMARLLLSTVEPGAQDPRWHSLIAAALDYVATASPRPEILLRFEKRLAELHGLYSSEIEPYTALLRHFSSLPTGRDTLLQNLPRITPAPNK